MSYNPTDRYVWAPDEKIELSGEEFAIMLNAVRSVLNLPEAPAIILAHQANQAIDDVMGRYVSSGVIKPVKPQMTVNEEGSNSD
jgi:hypothetical protein